MDAGTVEMTLQMRDRLTPQLRAATSDVAKFASTLGSASTQAARSLLPLSAAITGVGVAALKMATNLNESLANVSALLTDVSGPDLDRTVGEMKTKVRSLAVDLGKSTGDISGGLYEVISSLGLTADTFGQLEIAARAGAAGLATTKESFNFLSAVTKTYGDTSERAFKQAADLGFQAVNFGQTTFPELAAAIGGVAPIAKVAGVSMKEMFAIIATATGVTGNTSEVITQMASAINGLLNPSDDLKNLFKELGVVSGQALIAERGLVGALQAVAKSSADTGIPMLELIGRKEAFILASSLAGSQAKRFSELLGEMGKAADANGSIVENAFEKQTQGVNAAGFAWKQFKAEVQVALEQLGDTLIPIVTRAATAMRPLFDTVLRMVDGFGKLPQPVQTSVVAILGIVAAASPVLFALGGILTAVSSLSTALAWLAGRQAVMAVVGAFTGWGAIIPALTAKLLALSAAAGNLGGLAGPLGPLARGVSQLSSMGAASLGAGTAAGTLTSLLPALSVGLLGVGAAALYAWTEIEKIEKRQKTLIDKARETKELMNAWQKVGLPAGIDPSLLDAEARQRLLSMAAQAPRVGGGLQIDLSTARAGLEPSAPPPPRPRMTEEQQKLQAGLFSRDAIADVNNLLAVLGPVENVTRLVRDRQVELQRAIMQAVDAYRALGDQAPPKLRQVQTALHALITVPDIAHAQAMEMGRILEDRASENFDRIRTQFTAMGELGRQGEQVFIDWQMSQQSSVDKQLAAAAIWARGTLDHFRELETAAPETWERIRTAVAGTYQQMVRDAQNSVQVQIGVWSQFWTDLPSTVTAALTGGGSVAKSISNLLGNVLAGPVGEGPLSKLAVDGVNKIANGMGRAFGSVGRSIIDGLAGIIPGLGPLIGKGIELVWSGIKKLFGGGPSGRDLVKQFAEQFGGFDKLQSRLGALGKEGERLWASLTQGVGGTANAKRQIEAVTKALEQLEKIQGQVGQKLDGLSGLLSKFGGSAPASLRPLVEELLKSERLTDDIRAKLQMLSEGPSWQTLADAAARYGIEQDKLGQGFQQLKSNASFDQLFSDFTMFSDAGADARNVFEKMAPQINEALERARKFGIALPEFVRPMLQAFADAGVLTGEFGEKLTDLSGFKFDESIKSSLDGIRDVLLEIKELLTTPIVPNLLTPLQDYYQKKFGRFPGQDMSTPSSTPSFGFALGTQNRFRQFGTGTATVLHGQEAVVRPSDTGSLAEAIAAHLAAPSDSSPRMATFIFQIGPEEFARIQAPYIVNEAQRLGLFN